MNYIHWIIPIILVLVLGSFYFGKKLQLFFTFDSGWKKIIYWSLIIIFTNLVFLSRNLITGFLLYFLIFSLIYDIIHFLLSNFKKNINFLEKIYWKGIPLMILSLGITLYGSYNLHHPVIKEYNVSINNLKEEMIIGMISDLHLGIRHDNNVFTKLVEQANSLNADIFLLNGDIFDEYTTQELKELAYDSFSQIKTKYGIYYIEGNHDLLTEETRTGYEAHNIKILDDKVITINNNINLIGRRDYRNDKLNNPRRSLAELMEQRNSTLPTIVLDHQPRDQELAKNLEVDLQLSGHTHAGQIFPGNFFLQYGYKKNNDYQIIVSSGYGAWAFPLRTAANSEIVKIRLLKK